MGIAKRVGDTSGGGGRADVEGGAGLGSGDEGGEKGGLDGEDVGVRGLGDEDVGGGRGLGGGDRASTRLTTVTGRFVAADRLEGVNERSVSRAASRTVVDGGEMVAVIIEPPLTAIEIMSVVTPSRSLARVARKSSISKASIVESITACRVSAVGGGGAGGGDHSDLSTLVTHNIAATPAPPRQRIKRATHNRQTLHMRRFAFAPFAGDSGAGGMPRNSSWMRSLATSPSKESFP